MARIQALWRGEVRLVVTFWVYSIFGALAVHIPLVLAEEYPFPDSIIIVILHWSYYVFASSYNIFMWVAVWRSASCFAGLPIWAWFAKLTVIAGVCLAVITLLDLRS